MRHSCLRLSCLCLGVLHFYFGWRRFYHLGNEWNSSTAHTHTHTRTSSRGTNQTHFHLKWLNNLSIKQPGSSQTCWQWRGDKLCGRVLVLPSKIRLSDDATSPHNPPHQWRTQTSWWADAQWKMRALHAACGAAGCLIKAVCLKNMLNVSACLCNTKYSAKAY